MGGQAHASSERAFHVRLRAIVTSSRSSIPGALLFSLSLSLALAFVMPSEAETLREAGYSPHNPILLVPGYMSSALVVEESPYSDWVQRRVWIRMRSMGFEKMFTDALPVLKSLSAGVKAERQNKDTNLPADEVMLMVCRVWRTLVAPMRCSVWLTRARSASGSVTWCSRRTASPIPRASRCAPCQASRASRTSIRDESRASSAGCLAR